MCASGSECASGGQQHVVGILVCLLALAAVLYGWIRGGRP